MSRFFSEKYSALTAYTPGEQPRDRKYVKLNTNESPYPPAPAVAQAASREAGCCELYSDPTCKPLTDALAERYGVGSDMVLVTNGSDEIINFAFMAFCDGKRPIVFPDVTYGFYPVFAQLNGVDYEEIPLRDDFTVDADDYCGIGKNIILANPNAPTGIALPLADIERIVASNPDNIVVIDEAYVDFGGESAVGLVGKYPNLIVTQTFSKSRSLAGARLGYGIAQPELIADMNTIKYSTNPYNINRMSMAAGVAALLEDGYYMENCRAIAVTREWTASELGKRGFSVLPSSANFVFAASGAIDGGRLQAKLKERGVLVRHFTLPRIKNYNRITIGTRGQMEALLAAVDAIREEEGR